MSSVEERLTHVVEEKDKVGVVVSITDCGMSLSWLQEIRELQEQVRDLMFYLETQQKIAKAPEDTRQVG